MTSDLPSPSGGDAYQPVLSMTEYGPRADLTYRLIENLVLNDISLHRSLFTGSLLRNCAFTNVDFSRCDLDGIKVENCTFANCDLDGAELRSSSFSSCIFEATQLVNTHILDCSFLGCQFLRSPLTNSNISQTSFLSGRIQETSLEKTSCTLNRFEGVHLEDMILGNCTFLYAIMRGCSFKNVTVAAECVGMIYGLRRVDLAEFNFIYLGDEQAVPPDGNLVELLIELYRSRRWWIGHLVLQLNFQVTSPVFAIREFSGTLFSNLHRGLLVKTDELEFLSRVLQDLRVDQRLPFLNVIEIVEATSGILPRMSQGVQRDPRTEDAVARFSSSVFMMMNDMLEEFAFRRLQLHEQEPDSIIQLTATFQERPEISFSNLLDELGKFSMFPITVRTRQITTRAGSFIEVILTTLFTVLAAQIFLFLANGCVIQATELKSRLKILLSNRTPAYYRQTAMQPVQQVPEYLAGPMREILQYTTGLSWLSDPRLKGLTAPNLESLTLRRGEPDSARDSTTADQVDTVSGSQGERV
jgi:uncharacterized protein YjbI with pentapeptide repeats